ncbi:collagen alpha-2(VIII) chain-like [Trachypithecus francoisi]|uniref:collagen alpha-2(VIII) chain-like n=1 Tax=Trachypithecus francoisi TaxID=54180 RepID=UPI00141BADEC|nr:collagen alpha-2(VIII) chain-like [Trachypithecus francoisi]XP_033078335.1 collagen alpha-2(VIII) chain-like [Trachypithecus francoisi]
MAEETPQNRLAAAKKKVKTHQAMAPNPATDPSHDKTAARAHMTAEAHWTGPSNAGVSGIPTQKSCQSALPLQHQPSPCPHQSLQGDSGPVTPGVPVSITRPSPPADPSSTSLGSLGSCRQRPGSPSPRPHPRQSSLVDFGLVTPGVPGCRLCPPLLLPQGQPPWALPTGVSKDLLPNPVSPSPIMEW